MTDADAMIQQKRSNEFNKEREVRISSFTLKHFKKKKKNIENLFFFFSYAI